jgi:2-polyprenyl-3-methyl-5-hydroxy-6-metoxy-1,4-benzoquinol methylase
MNRPDWYYKCSRQEILPFIPPGVNKLLDIGCGEGNFGFLVKEKFGAEVWGIEHNVIAAAEAKKKLDNVLVGDVHEIINNINITDYDCVTFLDVLEHLADPYTVLLKTKRILSPSGYIVVSIPNVLYIGNLFKIIICKDWQYQDYGILDSSHLRFFTVKSFTRDLNDAGFRIHQKRGISPCRHRMLFYLFNLITFGYLHEARFMQFVFTAKK